MRQSGSVAEEVKSAYYVNDKLQFIGETIANESLPCVKGGGSRSETEGL